MGRKSVPEEFLTPGTEVFKLGIKLLVGGAALGATLMGVFKK